ncbi:MAG TPA: RNA-binding protein [Candidatus Obscuribacterales bacterium]
MQTRIFVHNLSAITRETHLQDLFATYGPVVSVEIIRDPAGQARGFGFVEMTTQVAAEAAIRGLNMHDLNGRQLGMRFADPSAGKKSGARGRHRR